MSGGQYGSYFAAFEGVANVATAIFGQVAANKYVRPAAYIKEDDVVVEEQHAGDGWKLLALGGGTLLLIVGAIIIAVRKA